MENSADEKITYHESPIYGIVKTLREKGYEITQGSSGIRRNGSALDKDVVGILEPREPIIGFFGRKKEQRALRLGTLWLNNEPRGAKEDEKWVLEVYGRDNVTKLTKLGEELAHPFDVRVQVRLESEQTVDESYRLDSYR